MNGQIYRNINTMTQLAGFIKTSEYPANKVDVYMLSQVLGVNIIVLERRASKRNEKAFYGFIYSMKKDFIILLETIRLNKAIYSIIEKGGVYVFKKKDLPDVILKEYQMDNSSNNNKK